MKRLTSILLVRFTKEALIIDHTWMRRPEFYISEILFILLCRFSGKNTFSGNFSRWFLHLKIPQTEWSFRFWSNYWEAPLSPGGRFQLWALWSVSLWPPPERISLGRPGVNPGFCIVNQWLKQGMLVCTENGCREVTLCGHSCPKAYPDPQLSIKSLPDVSS